MELNRKQNGKRQGEQAMSTIVHPDLTSQSSPCPFISEYFTNVKGDFMTRPGETYTRVPEVLNDALDHQYFFVKGIEVDYRYVMTSPVKDLIELIEAGDLRRSEVIHG